MCSLNFAALPRPLDWRLPSTMNTAALHASWICICRGAMFLVYHKSSRAWRTNARRELYRRPHPHRIVGRNAHAKRLKINIPEVERPRLCLGLQVRSSSTCLIDARYSGSGYL